MVLQGPEEPTPTLWEYRREVLKGSEMDAIDRGPDDAHLQTWNGLGLRGWELVSVERGWRCCRLLQKRTQIWCY